MMALRNLDRASWTWLCLAALGSLSWMGTAAAQNRADDTAWVHALDTIFNPQRAPERRTMGLVQRGDFLDLVESSRDRLEVALVIDGTDSMAGDIQKVRDALANMVEDLRRYKGDRVSFALVIYRDSGAPSGELAVPLGQFTIDPQILREAFAQIELESGAPYFAELVDLGVHAALTQLPWTAGEDTTRWLMLFGDAPPYEPDFVDAETGARRHYDTDLLVDTARRVGVQVNCVLCNSESSFTAFEKMAAQTRRFMNDLSSGTSGLMLDLSDPGIRQSLAAAAGQERAEVQRIGTITRGDVEAARRAADDHQSSMSQKRRTRLAVLPHLPLPQMNFDPGRPAVLVATELREKLRQIPGVDVLSPVEIERQVRRLSATTPAHNTDGEAATAQWLQALAVRLNADYVVWGSYTADAGTVAINSSVFSQERGTVLARAQVQAGDQLPEVELAGHLVTRLTSSAQADAPGTSLAVLVAAAADDAQVRENLLNPVANVPEARNPLLSGFEALEQSLAFALGSHESRQLLETAQRELETALQQDARNALAHSWLASCYFNQAQLLQRDGDADGALKKIEQFSDVLRRAFRLRSEMRNQEVRLEIEGDYKLFVEHDALAAVALFQQLAESTAKTPLKPALRAHWMLAGIYAGDWGVDPQLIDPEKARYHMIQILAHWEESYEAQFIRRALRWDDEKGISQYEYFPKTFELVLTRRIGE